MPNGECVDQFAVREDTRTGKFNRVWTEELDHVFADVAKYYDRANHIASLGLWNWFLNSFLSTMEIDGGQRGLDLCAGTNAVGLALLKQHPDLSICAMDRSEAMQAVGAERAARQGVNIESVIGDVHELPFPDNHFDFVTLQWASRHLRIMDVSREAMRVLKPGGYFYHCDMLRPDSRIVASLYYAYLRICLTGTAWVFRSSPVALNCRDYFISTLRMFYSAAEFSELLREVGINR